MTNNFAMYGVKIVVETCRDILYFPFWWYTGGLVMVGGAVWRFLCYRQKSLALFVWIKNIFKPMYGQRDWQGFLISVFMRVIQIIFRSILMCFWTFVSLILVMSWIIFPLFLFYQIFFQLI